MRFFANLVMAGALALGACSKDKTAETKPTETSTVERTSPQPMTPVTAATIIKADPAEWLSHGRTYSEQRHSPLSAINDGNVDQLGLSWSFDLGTSRGIEVTPIVHDGIMYITATWNIVYALDAKTGEMLWEFDPEIDRSRAAFTCCDIVNRGVAIWGDKVFTGTIDGRLIAINAKTGQKIWDELTIDLNDPYTITGAPRVVNSKVIIGNGGAELGVRGYITAYDAENGEQLWRFYTVPGNPEDGFENDTMADIAKTWNGEWWAKGGGGTVWDSMAYDPELDLLYIGVGNGSPWNHEERSDGEGDNLFLSSMVALRPDTGEYVWHYQTTPGETWDFTATQHMILADLEIEGETRKVIMQAPKNGFFYVIDRETGEFISGENFVPVNWATGIDPETGRPIEVAEARWPGKSPILQLPGPLGAHNWHPMSYSPDTGLVYIPAQEAPWAYAANTDERNRDGMWNTGTNFAIGMLPTDKATFKALKAMLKGRLIAWDPVKQQQAWKVEHKGPWNGGVLSTAGNLVFQGTADAHFAAYDAKTGEEKWKYFTQTGIVAAPISYEIDGEQYVTVASGWGGAYVLGFGGVLPQGSEGNVGRILSFKVDASQELEQVAAYDLPEPLDLPDVTASKEILETGLMLYANSCGTCHGDHAYASNLVPNLRYSYALTDPEYWEEILLEGALAENGMPNYGENFSKDDIEAIRAYVITEAKSDRGKEFYDEDLNP